MAEIVEFSSKVRLRPPPKPPGRRFGAEEDGTVLFLPCVRREAIEGDPVGGGLSASGDRKRIS